MIKHHNPTPKRKPFLRPQFIICIFLLSVTLVAFWQVRNHDFINLDDNLYIIDNPFIQQGLTIRGIRWAFTSAYSGHWHPITWLSHLLDYDLCGLNPRGHHVTNLLLHIANALLLFLLLQRMTGKRWQSCFVAALFAIHPLHVESVAWVAERKDLLCAFFWILTIWVYASYVEKPKLHRYLRIMLCFMLALMSKPMAVTLPFTLLLLDYWPLGRLKLEKGNANVRLIVEKLPLFFLAAALSVVTVFVHLRSGVISSFSKLPLWIRIENALVSYISYLAKMLWPASLAILYPYRMSLPFWKVAGAALLLIGITSLAICARKKHPYGIVGWMWYLGTLVPVIGLVQAGPQAMADRFTYLPLIGLFIIFAYGVPDILAPRDPRRIVSAVFGGLFLAILIIITICQVHLWQNSMSLFGHTLKVTTNNSIIQNNLGSTYVRQGRDTEASLHYSKALEINPNYADAHYNMGMLLFRQGKTDEAIFHLSETLRFTPGKADVHNNLGVLLFRQGKTRDASTHFMEALRLDPDYGEPYLNLGTALISQGKNQEAISHLNKALQINPGNAKVQNNLGVAFTRMGKTQEAATHYTRALQIDPGNSEAHSNIGSLLASQGRVEEAIAHYIEALRIEPDDGGLHYQLAVVLDRLGRKREAIGHLAEAIRLVPNFGKAHLALGMIYHEMGRKDSALLEYKTLHAIDPDLANRLYQSISKSFQ